MRIALALFFLNLCPQTIHQILGFPQSLAFFVIRRFCPRLGDSPGYLTTDGRLPVRPRIE